MSSKMSRFRALTKDMSDKIKVHDSLDNLKILLSSCFEGTFEDYTTRKNVQKALKQRVYPRHNLSLEIDDEGIPYVKSGDFKIYTYLSDDNHTLSVALDLTVRYGYPRYEGLYPRVRTFDKILSTQYVSLHKYDMLAHEVEATIEEYLDVIMVENFKYNDCRFDSSDLTSDVMAWSNESSYVEPSLEFKTINAVRRRFSSSNSMHLDMRNLVINKESILKVFDVFYHEVSYLFADNFSRFLDDSVLDKFIKRTKINDTHFELILGPYNVDMLFEDKKVSITKTLRSDIDMKTYGFRDVKQQYLIDMPSFDNIRTLDSLDIALKPLSDTMSDLVHDAATYLNNPDDDILFE